MSQLDLADLTRLPYLAVRRIAHPRSDPRLDQALRISEALALPIEDLFSLQPASPGSVRRRRSPDDASQ